MKWLKVLATTVVVLFVLVPLIAFVLVSTSAGTRFLVAQAIHFAPVHITYDEVSGTLTDAIEFEQLAVEFDGQRFAVARLNLVWRPFELLDKKLIIDELYLQQPYLQIAAQKTVSEGPVTLPTVSLPFSIAINHLVIDGFSVQTDAEPESRIDFETTFVTQLDLVDSQLDLNQMQLQFSQDQFAVEYQGQVSLQLRDTYPLNGDGDYELDFNDERLAPVTGSLDFDGALRNKPIQVATSFSTTTMPSQSLSVEITEPLEQLTWHAELNLNQLPLALAKPWLTDSVAVIDRYLTEESEISGKVQIDSENIAIENIRATHIGSADGQIALQGTWQHDNFTGDYQSNPLSFSLEYQQLSLSVNDIRINVASGQSAIEGTLADYKFSNELQLEVSGQPEIAIDDLTASINGNGSLHHVSVSQLLLNSDELKLDSQLDVAWQDPLALSFTINSASTSLGLPNTNNQALLKGAVVLKEHQLIFHDFAIGLGATQLQLNGSTAQNDLRGQLTVSDIQQLPYVPDGLSELQALETSFAIDTHRQLNVFDIEVSTFTVQTESLDKWLLTETAMLHFELKDEVWLGQLDSLCLQHEPNQFGALCGSIDIDESSLNASMSGERLSLWLLNRFRERDVAQRIAGLVRLEADVSVNREQLKVRDMNLMLRSDNTVFFALNQETSTRLAYWEIAANGNADAITANVEGQLANNEGGLFGDFSIADLYSEQTVQGNLIFALDDLAMLDWVLPGMRYHGGKATAQLDLSGTLAQPSINGDMEVYAESVVFAETNFVFNDVRLALIDRPDSDGALEIEGQAKAGEDGWVLIEGVALPLDAEAYLRITGRNFRALQMPAATVDVSPDLTVYVNDRAIEIAGTVDVPYAAISSPEFETSVSNSSDVVITSNGEPIAESQNSEDALAVNAQIRVNLGDRVSVDAYGFTGRLQGSLEIVEQPSRSTTAVGSINVADGSYEIYGQELNIDKGSFIYNGGDVSNPGLDLRVKRDISSGNSAGNVNVGAQVVGTLIEPDFRLFSTPAMPDSEILSYLILGKSMQSASSTSSSDIQLQALLMLGAKGTEAIGESLQDTFGIDEFGIDTDPNTRETSFYIGKYLSPKLFVKYGVGLLESTNTFMVRYQLTERLLIETMANSQAQGGDIFYTFER
ncbi:translocation/assembly module TamB domain-containing protein [Pseudidiomarina salilacus]|uniref:translocation/assembly module TamB domain-containing protein n=1 Tax=Pseudidiomarina salilacus TaxID=3384452 RepID=UPI0039847712